MTGLTGAALGTGYYLQLRRQAALDELLERLTLELPDHVAKVEAEIAALGDRHPWAGRYRSELVNITLWVAPEAGCVVTERACMGLSRANWGSVREHDGGLQLFLDPQNEQLEWPFPTVFKVVRNGETCHLQGEHFLRDIWDLHKSGDE